MWLYLNNSLFYTTIDDIIGSPWVENRYEDYTQKWGDFFYPRVGASAMKVDSESTQINVLQGLTKFYLGNGEEFMYRQGLNDSWNNSLMNMPA
jgi:hypothetical protein